jgi:hypothetical protein
MKTTILRNGELQTPTNYSIKVRGLSLLKKEVSRKKNVGEDRNRLELWKTYLEKWVIGSTFYMKTPLNKMRMAQIMGKRQVSKLVSQVKFKLGNCIYMVGVDGQSEG